MEISEVDRLAINGTGGSAGNSRSFVAAAAVLSATAVFGAVLGARALTGSSPAAPAAGAAAPHESIHAIHEDIPASFGVVAVEILEKTAGVSSRALSGSTHFPSRVSPNQLQVQATVNIRNALPQPVRLRAGQFTLVTGGTRFRHSRATVEQVKLQPDALLDLMVSFTVPRNGKPLVLEIDDPATPTAIRIDLGRAQARVEDAGGDHSHATPRVQP